MTRVISAVCLLLLTGMIGFQFVRAETARYDRLHLSTEEAIAEANSDNSELERIYEIYRLQCEKRGITVEDLRNGKSCD